MHIHFIGICGVAMSALAIAFHKQGHTVTGSDKGFYPPVSDHLKQAGIAFYPGWHPEKMTAGGTPDVVIVGNVAGSNNPEWAYVQEHGLPYKSYPEAIAEYLIKKTSIVCAGTYGKTTTAALLSWIFSECGKEPNYMFGGLLQADFPAAALTSSDISIVEGDEYKTARWDEKAKFFHYSPTHLLLTAVEWDHADVYPTEAAYGAAFLELIDRIPNSGTIVYSEDVPDEIVKKIREHGVRSLCYGTDASCDVRAEHISLTMNGMRFTVHWDGATYAVKTHLLDEYNAKNILGCFSLALQHGLAPNDILAAIANFPGIKRRLERRNTGTVALFDDIAHSPAKAASVLQTLKKITAGKIYAVFEPNTGNRQREAIPAYTGAFSNADEVIIGRLTQLKVDPMGPEPLDGKALAAVINASHPHVAFIPDDDALVAYLKEKTHPGDVVVFLGSHGFRGMIELLSQQLP